KLIFRAEIQRLYSLVDSLDYEPPVCHICIEHDLSESEDLFTESTDLLETDYSSKLMSKESYDFFELLKLACYDLKNVQDSIEDICNMSIVIEDACLALMVELQDLNVELTKDVDTAVDIGYSMQDLLSDSFSFTGKCLRNISPSALIFDF